jgi:hypothetical protein
MKGRILAIVLLACRSIIVASAFQQASPSFLSTVTKPSFLNDPTRWMSSLDSAEDKKPDESSQGEQQPSAAEAWASSQQQNQATAANGVDVVKPNKTKKFVVVGAGWGGW